MKRQRPQITSADRVSIYRSMFLMNRAFHAAVTRLDELAGLLGKRDLRDMRGMTQEIQTEINSLLLNRLESIENNDWAQFGKIRIALEKRLKS